MCASTDLQERLRETIDRGLRDEDADVVAKFAGHALAYLRLYPPEVEPESIFKGPRKGALEGYSIQGVN